MVLNVGQAFSQSYVDTGVYPQTTLNTGGGAVNSYPAPVETVTGITFPETGTTYYPADPSWGGINPGYGRAHPTGWGTTWTTIEPTPAPAVRPYEDITVVPAD